MHTTTPQTAPLLILASRSVGRVHLLRSAGYRFVQLTPPFDDSLHPGDFDQNRPEDVVMSLADQKAHSLLNDSDLQQYPGAVIVAADTVILAPDGSVLGQPADRSDARRMLRMLIDATHHAHTAVVLLDLDSKRGQRFANTVQVKLGRVSDEQVERYLDSDRWRGKAGAYNLYDLQGHWPFTVTGDPTTVVGLPMEKLADHLQQRDHAAVGDPTGTCCSHES